MQINTIIAQSSSIHKNNHFSGQGHATFLTSGVTALKYLPLLLPLGFLLFVAVSLLHIQSSIDLHFCYPWLKKISLCAQHCLHWPGA